jgi:hypothetical protein
MQLGFVMAVTVLFGGFAMTPSYGQTTTNTQVFRIPVSVETTICGGKDVVLSGTILVMAHSKVTPSGGSYVIGGTTFQDTKVTDVATGATGTFTEAARSLFQVQQTSATKVVDTDGGTLTIPSEGIHLRVHVTFVIVINANGQATANVENISSDCP